MLAHLWRPCPDHGVNQAHAVKADVPAADLILRDPLCIDVQRTRQTRPKRTPRRSVDRAGLYATPQAHSRVAGRTRFVGGPSVASPAKRSDQFSRPAVGHRTQAVLPAAGSDQSVERAILAHCTALHWGRRRGSPRGKSRLRHADR